MNPENRPDYTDVETQPINISLILSQKRFRSVEV